ncbi:MAG: hypothetical protein WDO72_12365 [Pseudomonadota bacterium]
MRADPKFKPLPAEPATLLTEGKVIEAIKVLRASHGLDLKQAKDWVDWHIAQDPMLRVQLETQQRALRRKIFMWFLLVDALIAAGLIYYFFYRGSV